MTAPKALQMQVKWYQAEAPSSQSQQGREFWARRVCNSVHVGFSAEEQLTNDRSFRLGPTMNPGTKSSLSNAIPVINRPHWLSTTICYEAISAQPLTNSSQGIIESANILRLPVSMNFSVASPKSLTKEVARLRTAFRPISLLHVSLQMRRNYRSS